jgi:hypothetical protein
MPGLHAACLDCLMWREKGRKRTEAHCIDFLSKLLHSIIPDPKIDPCAGLCSMRDKSLLMWHSSYRVCLTSLSCDCRDPLERLVRDLSIYKDNSDFERQVLAIYEKVVKGALAEKEVSFVKSLDSTLSTASSSRPPASPDIDGREPDTLRWIKQQKELQLANLKSHAGPKVSSFRQDRRASHLVQQKSMVSMPIEGVSTTDSRFSEIRM